MHKKSGEMLIETIFSCVIFVGVIIPLFKTNISAYITHKKINVEITKQGYIFNVIEYMKDMKYTNVATISKLEFNSTYSMLEYFNIPTKYYENIDSKYQVKVTKINEEVLMIDINGTRGFYTKTK